MLLSAVDFMSDVKKKHSFTCAWKNISLQTTINNIFIEQLNKDRYLCVSVYIHVSKTIGLTAP